MKYLLHSLGLSAILILFVGCALGPKPPQVTGAVRAPIDFNDVGLYLPQCKPEHYKKVAKLDASKLGNFSSYPFDLNWLEKLRKQAAGLGANGLLLVQISVPGADFGGSLGSLAPPTPGSGFQVEAIYATASETAFGEAMPGCATCSSKLEALLSASSANHSPFGYATHHSPFDNTPTKGVHPIVCGVESGNGGI